jgi:integrase
MSTASAFQPRLRGREVGGVEMVLLDALAPSGRLASSSDSQNPQRRRTEKRPFESWEELEAIVDRLGPRLGPMVLFAAATGMRPGEWVALEHRDIDRAGRVAYVNRSFSKGRLTYPKTDASIRAVPLQARAFAALDHLSPGGPTFALRAGISTFELSRYMGASLTMIDRHYGHLARDGREHAIRLLDDLNAPAVDVRGRPVDAEKRRRRRTGQRNKALSRQ